MLELIVVIAIIGVLSVIILPSFKNALDKANATKVSQNIINTIKRYDVFMAKWEFEEGSGLIAKDTAVNPVDTTVQNNATIPVSELLIQIILMLVHPKNHYCSMVLIILLL